MKRKIAVICIHWIGDSFWAVQPLNLLQEKFKDDEIYIICKSHSKFLFKYCFDETNIIICDSICSDRLREKFSVSQFISDIRKCRKLRFDEVIDLSNNYFTSIFTYFLRAKISRGIKAGFWSKCYTNTCLEFNYDKHLSKKPWFILEQMYGGFEYREPQFFKQLSKIEKTKTALLIPGAGWEEKRWPVTVFSDLGKLLIRHNYKVFIVGSPKEKNILLEVHKELPEGEIFKGSLEELVQLIPTVSASVGNDSGLGHLLAASGSRHVSLFTPETDPEKCRPLGPSVKVFHEMEIDKIKSFLLEYAG